MESSIDFDVVVHLGCLENIDLATRGVYYLELVLFYGKPSNYKKNKNYIKITPVGMFSAPTTIQSNVKGQAIPLAPMLDHSQVDEINQSFRTRVFVIRYKDEIHELNDGVHWRLTVPNVDLMPLGEGVGPACLDLLHVHIKLMGVSLINDPAVDMYKNVQKLIPSGDLEFKVISEQTLSIQRASSGFHEFFPIRFDRLNFVDLDCMVHCGVTAIRYSIISLNLFYSKSSIRNGKSDNNNVTAEDNSSNDDKGDNPKEGMRQLYVPLKKETTNISNVNEERSNLQFLMNRQESKRRGSLMQQAAKPMIPSKFDVDTDITPPPVPAATLSSDSLDSVDSVRSKSGLSQLELVQHTNLYFAPLIANYYTLISASSNIFKLYMTSLTIGKDENVVDNTDETTCILDHKDKIIAELMDLSSLYSSFIFSACILVLRSCITH